MDAEMLSESELNERLQRGNPVDRAALDDAGVRAALTSVRLNVESGTLPPVPSGSARRFVHRRRWVTLGVAAAAAAVASLIGVETLTGGAGSSNLPLSVSPAAAAQLDKVARAAAVQATPSAGQWTYVASRYWQAGASTAGGATVDYSLTTVEQNWYAPNGEARERATSGGVSFNTPQDKATYLSDESTFDKQIPLADTAPGAVINDSVMQDLGWPNHIAEQTSPPSTPQALIKEDLAFPTMSHGVVAPNRTPEPPWVIWTDLSKILLDSPSAQLRSTAYAALAYVPYTKVLGDQTDQLGRSGIAIYFAPEGAARDGGDTNWTLIVSPSTGDLLEEDQTLASASDGLPAGTLTEREIFLQRAIVDSDTALPGGGSQGIGAASPTTTTPAAQTTTVATQTTSATQDTIPAASTATSAVPTTTAPAQTTTTPASTTLTAPQTTTTPASPTTTTTTSQG